MIWDVQKAIVVCIHPTPDCVIDHLPVPRAVEELDSIRYNAMVEWVIEQKPIIPGCYIMWKVYFK